MSKMWEEIKTLLGSLYDLNSSNTYDNEEVQDRITKTYLKLVEKTATPERAVEIAKKQSNGFKRNKYIEEYFQANRFELSWNELKVLLAGLYDLNSSNTYDNEEVQDRMIIDWNDCQ